MVPQYSGRYIQPSRDLERVVFGVTYVDDNLAVEFWADVYDHETGEVVIVTGRYCELFGELEFVWVDHEGLQAGHPLRTLLESDRELLTACEHEHQRSRFRALDALVY